MRSVALSLTSVAVLVGCSCSTVEVTPEGGGGTGGSGGSGGAEYEPFPDTCTTPVIQGVCDGEVAKCGNGSLDTCEICWTVDGSPEQCADVTEACDTEASLSCEDLGFAGGGRTLCGPACTHDVRDCDSCLGSDHQLGCARPRVDGFDVLDVQLASTGDTLAAAWMSFDGALHFARFTPDLELLDQREGCATVGVGPLALAPTPGGWMLAVGGFGDSPETQLFRLDAAGNEIGAPRLLPDAAYPVLVPRPGATPFLVYTSTPFAASQGDLIAELLDEEGAAVWQSFVTDGVFGELTAAATTDPGLLVAARRTDGVTSTTVFVSLDEAGAPSPPREVSDAVEVALAPASPGRVVAVWRRGEAVELQWLDGAGEDVGPRVLLAPKDPVTATQERSVIVSEGRAIVLLAEDMRRKLSLFHIESDGSSAAQPYALAYEPGEVAWLAGAPIGADAVFAWTTYSADPGASRFVLGSVRR